VPLSIGRTPGLAADADRRSQRRCVVRRGGWGGVWESLPPLAYYYTPSRIFSPRGFLDFWADDVGCPGIIHVGAGPLSDLHLAFALVFG
jgi:hypothetical protein